MARKTGTQTKAYQEAYKEYRSLAKRADQRLVRLEKMSGEKKYKGVTKFAYARAQRDIKAWSGENARRFNTAPPKSIQALKAKIADIRNFLEAATSTKRGIEKSYEKQLTNWNKKLGTNFTWQDMEKYYNRGIAKKLEKHGYNAHKAIAYIKEHQEEIKRKIRQHKKQDIDVDDDILEETIRSILSHNRKDLNILGISF